MKGITQGLSFRYVKQHCINNESLASSLNAAVCSSKCYILKFVYCFVNCFLLYVGLHDVGMHSW